MRQNTHVLPAGLVGSIFVMRSLASLTRLCSDRMRSHNARLTATQPWSANFACLSERSARFTRSLALANSKLKISIIIIPLRLRSLRLLTGFDPICSDRTRRNAGTERSDCAGEVPTSQPSRGAVPARAKRAVSEITNLLTKIPSAPESYPCRGRSISATRWRSWPRWASVSRIA